MTGRPHTPTVAITRPDWFDRAECRGLDPGMFFPSQQGDLMRAAIAVCRRCQVRSACLDWALETGEDTGVYGGLTARERTRIRRRRGMG